MGARSREVRVERSSLLAAPAGEVWRRAATMAGVNEELRPVVRMTHPAELRSLVEEGPRAVGRVAFRSWLLAGGVVPFDRHSLRLLAVDDRGDDGGGFVEDSTSWLQARWRHEREVEPAGPDRCRVTDRLLVEPRVGPAAPLVGAVVGRIFDHRHRVLRRRYGSAD